MEKFEEKVEIKKAFPEDFEKAINVIANAFDEEGNEKEQYLKSKNKFQYLFKNNWHFEDNHIGYKLEILYLLSLKQRKLTEADKFYKEIQENILVSDTIKERVKKINEFEKYK